MEIKKEVIKVVILWNLKKKDYSIVGLHNAIKEIVLISEASLFSLLNQLENENLISTYSKVEKGHTKKIYQITSLGSMRLDRFDKEYEMILEVGKYIRRG